MISVWTVIKEAAHRNRTRDASVTTHAFKWHCKRIRRFKNPDGGPLLLNSFAFSIQRSKKVRIQSRLRQPIEATNRTRWKRLLRLPGKWIWRERDWIIKALIGAAIGALIGKYWLK